MGKELLFGKFGKVYMTNVGCKRSFIRYSKGGRISGMGRYAGRRKDK